MQLKLLNLELYTIFKVLQMKNKIKLSNRRDFIKLSITTAMLLSIGGLSALVTPLNASSLLSNQKADSIYINAKVYTVDTTKEWAEAFAIKDGKFIGVGTTKEIEKFASKDTKVIDLGGAFVMPSLIDEHLHPDMGADNYLNVFIAVSDDWKQITQKLKEFRKQNPQKRWIYGSSIDWLLDDNGIIANYGVASNKSVLDSIVDDRPVALWDQGAHAMLLNSLALKELGLNDNSPNPKGGILVKDKRGKLTGVIRETACTLVVNALDNFSQKEWRDKGLLPFLDEMSSYGVTGLSDAYVVEKSAKAYTSLEKEKRLNHWINLNMAAPLEYNDPQKIKEQTEFIKQSKKYQTEQVYVAGIKYILDGAAAGKTAAMLEPFENDTFDGGLRYDEKALRKSIKEYANSGFSIKAHSIGDRGVRLLLEIYETLPKRAEGSRYSIAHGVFVHPDDVNRFAPMDVVYEASPALWYPNNAIPIIESDIGKRVKHAWPISRLIANNTVVSYGSDWPVSATPNPWFGMESMVTRQSPGGSKDAFNPEFAVDLKTAIKIFTLNGAISMGIAHKTGSICVGKSADFIVLDKSLFDMSQFKIHQTKVKATLFRGEKIYTTKEGS